MFLKQHDLILTTLLLIFAGYRPSHLASLSRRLLRSEFTAGDRRRTDRVRRSIGASGTFGKDELASLALTFNRMVMRCKKPTRKSGTLSRPGGTW